MGKALDQADFMDERLKKLYQEVILVHNKEPYHFEKKEGAGLALNAYNPICGDKFQLFLSVEGEQIKEIYFHGYGCAISKSATSVLSQSLEGKSLGEIQELISLYFKALDGEITEETPAEFEAFSAAQAFPGRKQCASLSWDELNKWLLAQS